MSSSFWLLAVGSRDLSKAEKEITACKAKQIHKMATISENSCYFVNLPSFSSNYFFLSLR
jgi:hypothetical protein